MSLLKIASKLLLMYVFISVLLCSHTQGNNSTSNSSTNSARILSELFYDNESMYSFYDNYNTPTSSCDEPTSTKHIALAIFSTVVLILGVIGNMMVILVIQYSHFRKEPGYTLVISLAAADLGVSLFVTSSKVHSYRMNGNFCSDLSFCVFHHVTDGLFPTASITHLLFISVNKFCAVVSPYNYHRFMTHSKEVLVVFCLWVYCVLWTCAGMIEWDKNAIFSIYVLSDGIDRLCYNLNALFYVVAAICVFIIPVIIACILYTILLLIVMDKMKSTPGLPGVERSSLEAFQSTSTQQRFGNTKGVKTFMMVFAGWVVCWMPHFSSILAQYVDPSTLMKFHKEHPWWSEFIGTVISDILPCINSCINPFIYFKTSSICRHAFKDSYLKLMKKPRYRVGSGSVMAIAKTSIPPSFETVVKYTASEGQEYVMFVPLRPNF